MALLDIVVEGYQIEQEEARGNIGVITDMVVDYKDEVVVEIPIIVGGGSFEYVFGTVG